MHFEHRYCSPEFQSLIRNYYYDAQTLMDSSNAKNHIQISDDRPILSRVAQPSLTLTTFVKAYWGRLTSLFELTHDLVAATTSNQYAGVAFYDFDNTLTCEFSCVKIKSSTQDIFTHAQAGYAKIDKATIEDNIKNNIVLHLNGGAEKISLAQAISRNYAIVILTSNWDVQWVYQHLMSEKLFGGLEPHGLQHVYIKTRAIKAPRKHKVDKIVECLEHFAAQNLFEKKRADFPVYFYDDTFVYIQAALNKLGQELTAVGIATNNIHLYWIDAGYVENDGGGYAPYFATKSGTNADINFTATRIIDEASLQACNSRRKIAMNAGGRAFTDALTASPAFGDPTSASASAAVREPVPPKSNTKSFCTNCGTARRSLQHNFCVNCGTQL